MHHARVEGLLDGEDIRAMPKYADLDGVNVFITGGGSGVGAYLVTSFALQGAHVGFVSLPSDPAEPLCAGVERLCGRRPLFYPCDVRQVAALQAAMVDFQERRGAISVLVNNAARDTRHDVASLRVDEWDDAIDTNLRPYFFTTQFAAARMKAAGGGSIINLGSNCAYLGLQGYPAYVASKSGILGLTKALARELGSDNIRVNALVPGWVMTERQKKMWVTEQSLTECLAQQSLKETITGRDIAQAALFLGSNASRMMTGQSLIVDGGRC